MLTGMDINNAIADEFMVRVLAGQPVATDLHLHPDTFKRYVAWCHAKVNSDGCIGARVDVPNGQMELKISPCETVEVDDLVFRPHPMKARREALWRSLSDEDRLAMIEMCCRGCGSLDLGCHCQNDD
jgi:hypothetical protein